MKKILKNKNTSITAGKDGRFRTVGELVNVVNRAERREFIDGRVIKEYY